MALYFFGRSTGTTLFLPFFLSVFFLLDVHFPGIQLICLFLQAEAVSFTDTPPIFDFLSETFLKTNDVPKISLSQRVQFYPSPHNLLQVTSEGFFPPLLLPFSSLF